MSNARLGPASSTVPRQVSQVRNVLTRDFSDLIDMRDFKNKQPHEWEPAFLSRALAALVVRNVIDCDLRDAAMAVIDGRDDFGIDAVAISETSQHVWLIQSKWSDTGRAGFNTEAAHKFVDGLHQIDQRNFHRFNERLQRFEDRLRAVLRGPSQITLVLALMGPGELSSDVRRIFDDEVEEMNGYGPRLDYRVVNARDLWQQVRENEAPEPVTITATMRQWIYLNSPVEVYQGVVSADDIAQWTVDSDGRLFTDNIRESLGASATEVNVGMLTTLKSDPDLFLHFNNGVTVLCDSVGTEFPGRRRQDSPVTLTLHGASVVNGAQTVTAIHQAMRDTPGPAADADVSVHVICTKGGPHEFAKRITKTRNKQNRVEDRDFVALDEVQALIREDFALTLERTYTYKRGEADPGPEYGCSVVQAAVALACAHPNPKLVVRAKQNVDTLWEQGPEGAYPMLFGEQPGAHQIWGSVRLQRAIGTELHKIGKRLKGRASDVTDRADLFITHLTFQIIDRQGIEDDEYDWEGVIRRVPELVPEVLARLMRHVDAEYGPESRKSLSRTLADPTRCRHLAQLVVQDAHEGTPLPPVAEEYQKARQRKQTRRPNSVIVVLDAGRIAEGTPLTYKANYPAEAAALQHWLAADSRRGTATWVNNRRYPLLWGYDGRQYSPTGLAMRMYGLAEWDGAPVAVQGPSRWFLGDESLVDLAQQIFADLGDQE